MGDFVGYDVGDDVGYDVGYDVGEFVGEGVGYDVGDGVALQMPALQTYPALQRPLGYEGEHNANWQTIRV